MNYLEINESNIQSFNYDKTIVSNGKILGSCELGKAEIQLLNNSNEYSSYKNNWINTQFGSMYIYDVKPVQEKVNISLSCYDIKYKLDVKYDKSLFEKLFPCTLLVWREAIAAYCGISFADDGDFANADYVLNTHPFVEEGSSCRNVIGLIAEAGASAIDTDFNDYFYFVFNIDKSNVVNDWLDLTTEKENTQPVNMVVLGRGDVEDIEIYPNPQPENAKELRINNNYILDPQDTTAENDRRKEVIEPIYNRVNGFTYIPFELRTQDIDNKLDLKLGQKIIYQDIYDNEIEAYLMTISYKYLGGDLNNSESYEITLSAEELNETNSNYSYAGSPSKQIAQIGISVDKQNEKIELLAKKTGEFDNSLTQITQDYDTIKQYAESNYNLVRMTKGNNIILVNEMQENGIVRLKISGPIKLLYPNEGLYPREGLYPIGTNLIIENEDGTIIKNNLPITSDLEENDYFLWNYSLDEKKENYVVTAEIIRANGTKEPLEPITIIAPKGNNKIYMECFEGLTYEIDYATLNQITDSFATKIEMNSAITQSASSIKQEVNANIEGVNKSLSAELELKVNTKDLVSEINAKANVITITSDNFKLEKDGSVTASAMDINGGTIDLTTDLGNVTIGKGTSGLISMTATYQEEDYEAMYNVGGMYYKKGGNYRFRIASASDTPYLYLYNSSNEQVASLRVSTDFGILNLADSSGTDTIVATGKTGHIKCVTLTQTSLEEHKKNIELYEKDALEEIKNIDIYKYNLKHEKDQDKKHLGFIIGKNYNYSKEITSLDEAGKEIGVDNYSMSALNMKAIQELLEKVEKLEKRIKELEGDK